MIMIMIILSSFYNHNYNQFKVWSCFNSFREEKRRKKKNLPKSRPSLPLPPPPHPPLPQKRSNPSITPYNLKLKKKIEEKKKCFGS